MAEKAKYHAQKLTQEDTDVLEQVFLKYVLKYYGLTQQYPNPKKYAEKVSETVRSEKDFAPLYTIIYLKNSPDDHLFKPSELKQRLENDIRQTYTHVTIEMEDYISRDKRLLSSRFLRENVLQKLEDDNIVIHMEGKKEIRSYQRHLSRRGGKPSGHASDNDRGGKPSAYKISDEVKKLKKVMSKPEALDFLFDKITSSGLAFKLAKFTFLVYLYAAKMNEKFLTSMMGVGASLFQQNLTKTDLADSRFMFQQLQKLDDNALEEIADKIAKEAVEDRGYYNTVLFMAGLLKL